MSELTNENIINEIIKKPRKPRMSSIVSKAVLLKQLSKTNLIVPKEEVIEEWSLDLSCPPLIEKNNKETINQFHIPISNKENEVIAPSPTSTPNKKEEEEDNRIKKEVLFVGRCDLCDVDYKSVILFNRLMALHKQAQITSA